MGLTPTQRTLNALRERGIKPAVVEKFNRFAGPHGKRQDMFGIIDIIGLDKERGVIGVQSTGTAFSEHNRKLTEEKRQECIDWLSTPGTRLELWGWRKVRRNGRLVMEPRIKEYTLEDFKDGSEN